jgi:hypothetical protein
MTVTKLYRPQAEVTLVNPNVRHIGQGETMYGKYKKLKLGGCQHYERSAD